MVNDRRLFSHIQPFSPHLELVLMMERVFSGKISNSDELTIKYLDDDGDKITLLNDGDLTVALHFHKLLRLFVFVNGREQINNSADNLKQDGNLVDGKTFHNELKDIRQSVQTILDRLQVSTNEVSAATVAPTTTRDPDSHKHFNQQQQQQQRSATPENNQTNATHLTTNEHPTAPTKTADTQHTSTPDAHQAPPSQFQQMPTPHFAPSGYNHEQQAKMNVFGPPPTAFPGMPAAPNAAAPRFPPATTPNSSAPPPFNSTPTSPPLATGPPSGFLGQHASAPPPQQGGFYAQQQATSSPPQPGGFYAQQQGPAAGNYNPTNTFPPQQQATSNSSPATINPSFAQPPPPMAFQQSYGAYSPQNSYYNSPQQYPK